MENSTDYHSEPSDGDASSTTENHRTFFTDQLNRTYAVKLRMAEILDELLEQNLFTDLAIAIRATGGLIRGQIARIEEIYVILAISPLFTKPNELLVLIEEGYLATQQKNETPVFELSLLAFLQSAESLEIASFKVLQLAAPELNSPLVTELLGQCTSGAEADYQLLLTLMAGYLKS